jgi:FtsH-binding integral membrane protein
MNKLLGWCGPVLFVLGLITTFALEAPAIGIVLFVLGAIIWAVTTVLDLSNIMRRTLDVARKRLPNKPQ